MKHYPPDSHNGHEKCGLTIHLYSYYISVKKRLTIYDFILFQKKTLPVECILQLKTKKLCPIRRICIQNKQF